MDAEQYVVVWLPDADLGRDRVTVIGPLDSDQVDIVMDVHRKLGHPFRIFSEDEIEGYQHWREWAEEYADLEPAKDSTEGLEEVDHP